MKTAKEWADKYLKGRDHITDLIKEVQQDIIRETVKRCLEKTDEYCVMPEIYKKLINKVSDTMIKELEL